MITQFRKMITLIFVVINRLFPVKSAIWIQLKMISGQRKDKNLRLIYCQLRSEFLSLKRNQLQQQNFWSIIGDHLFRHHVLIVTLNDANSAFLGFPRLLACSMNACPYGLMPDHPKHIFLGKLMEDVDPSSVLFVRRADLGCTPSLLVPAQVLAASPRR